ncbi:hypothetical protein [Streptomyces eurocidicus]|uniref:Lipoprotein n=1 Tax=Streptomyces eurocidicus TaxID=66423 RepID=A0A7W8B6D0_STREU|nr:hypothetical protein [Streptomyces eurocidicus]MBB5117630.1 hypothetical protein [Streptomyces eurocidicus]MBF6053467.1 hypothetical protein [Streptomyces eurocidicus]
MRHRARPVALLTLVLLAGPAAGASLAGCQAPVRAAGDDRRPVAASVPPSPALPEPGATFLARSACAGGGGASFTEVSCASERAVARVLARYNGPRDDGPRCPAATDFVLHITAVDRGTSEEDSAPEGYACMRNLQEPHPGDPGRGGGPLTVTGDCVYAERRGVVKETACDGSGPHAPEYRVTREVGARADCPASTDLYVHVGGGTPIGCARRLV